MYTAQELDHIPKFHFSPDSDRHFNSTFFLSPDGVDVVASLHRVAIAKVNRQFHKPFAFVPIPNRTSVEIISLSAHIQSLYIPKRQVLCPVKLFS
jgi:hypothetical protein